MPDVVLNTKHPGTESLNAIRDWLDDKFALKEDKTEGSFIIRLSFDPKYIGQPWVLTGGTERYTGTVKSTPDDVIVDGIDDNSNPIVYTFVTNTIEGIEIKKFFELKQTEKYYPFGVYAVHITYYYLFIYQDGYTDLISIFDGDSYNFSAFISTTVGDSFSSGGRGWTRASGDTAVVCNERWTSNYGGFIVFAKSLESLEYTSVTPSGYQVHKVKDYNMYGATLSGTWSGNTEVSFTHDNATRNLANIAQYNYTLTNGEVTNNELSFSGWENILEKIETIVNTY